MKRLCVALFLVNGFMAAPASAQVPVHQDTPFWQDYSIKYYWNNTVNKPTSVASDRNGKVQLVGGGSLYQTNSGALLFPGDVIFDNTYRFMKDKKIQAVTRFEDQLVYLTDKLVLSNAWSGKPYSQHQLPNAKFFSVGSGLQALVSDGKAFNFVANDQILWKGNASDEVIGITYQPNANAYWILGKNTLSVFSPSSKTVSQVLKGKGFTAFDVVPAQNRVVIGTKDGYITYNIATKEQDGDIQKRLPVTDITTIKVIGDKIWMGTSFGAFAINSNNKIDYYNGNRWLTDNKVNQIVEGPDNSVVVLTETGVTKIAFEKMTLEDKANFYDQQVRSRHIRNGFNSSLSGIVNGNPFTGYLDDSDNDGLWTSMYLGAEVYRYAVTRSPEALKNCKESLEAMERLFDVNPVAGFPARSYERTGHIKELSDPERWQKSADKDWDWKATTSSDEAIGHVFVFGALAELVDEPVLQQKAITLLDTLMDHIIRNDMYLVDYDGKPTQWGKWNPSYVNGFEKSVGDRKLNSSNIIAMLQTAYHFTKKDKYKDKAFELMNKHGYLENLMRPMKTIGVTDKADDLSALLSDGWNHSDDEMYFLGYWGLYRYAFNDTLKAQYKEAIIDHFEAERPEKDGLWNLFTAITGTSDFDLKEAVWYLQEHPMDLISWELKNSHRKDLDFIKDNFRKQTTKVVLPPDERRVQRHNANMFELDRNYGNGGSEHSAGDIWLLPYWLGRYLGVITAPTK